ncbi:MAG: hypothetical protein JWO91_2457 [Acidobacteriaceae bacterium]|nr:hypothetical protein [Acidobacteriaceae bacterium]
MTIDTPLMTNSQTFRRNCWRVCNRLEYESLITFRFVAFAMRLGFGIRSYVRFLAVLSLLAVVALPGQPQETSNSATLQGFVRDSHKHPIAAIVYLQAENGTQALATHTDPSGHYEFSALLEGVYTIRADSAGYSQAGVSSCAVRQNEAKTVDLTLDLKNASTTGSMPAPDFFDEPQFTIAGVTDTTNLGGHGSTTIARSTNVLSKGVPSLDTDSLKVKPQNNSRSDSSEAEQSLRAAVKSHPADFETNHRLGKLLVEDGKALDAIPYLERASQLNPGDYENSYDLARAYAEVGSYELARKNALVLLKRQDKAEVHNLLGNIDEKLNDSLDAVREFQRAAELNPSEANLFDWGAELLAHHAAKPAAEVFAKGNRLFPRSVRMLVGLGVALYAHGSYDASAQRLCEASDLNPDDPKPYLYLGEMQNVDGTKSEGSLSENSVAKLARFVHLQPENALANYYYALSLWNGRKGPEDTKHLTQVESLLKKAVQLDPRLGAAYLQLGVLYASRADFPGAISAYQKAIENSPKLEQAHYRLAQAYKRTGEKTKAQSELQLYQLASKDAAEQAERERHETQQFVYTLRNEGLVQPRP